MDFRTRSDRALCLETLRVLGGDFRAAWMDKDGAKFHEQVAKELAEPQMPWQKKK